MDVLGSLFTLVVMMVGALIWILPIVLIAASSRTEGKEKLAWILAVVFISWFAWIFYLLLAPLRRPARESYRYRY